jgi:ribosomal protein S18 acetylase RimI-like enzyme
MLDYTLVSPKATYRMPTPRDMPALVKLMQAFSREEPGSTEPGGELPAERALATVAELSRSRDRGSLFVFEREGALAGYAILILYWSNELGGTVLAVDELYVEPGQRRQGIASDFLALLGKVAPQGVVSIQLEVNRANRRGLGLCRKLGFQDTGRQVISLPIERK